MLRGVWQGGAGLTGECASLSPCPLHLPRPLASVPTGAAAGLHSATSMQGLLDPKSLEDLTGLTELHAASEAALEAWEASDEEEEQEGGSGVGRQGRASGGGGDDDEWCEL